MPKNKRIDAVDVNYEFRVWGEYPKAHERLMELASEVIVEEVSDCYLLIDDPAWNAKVRDRSMKVKQLVAEQSGFEQWTSDWYQQADGVPEPFDALFIALRLGRRNKTKDLSKAAAKLVDTSARIVFVEKRRRRYRIGDIRAEVADIEIVGSSERLFSLAIEGPDLDAMVALREELGLNNVPNKAMHLAVGEHG